MPRVQSNGISLYYEIQGEGQPLLLIHGLGSSTRDWEFQVAEFSKSFQVITFDLRGHGQSDKPAGPYSMPMFAKDTSGLLKELSIDQAHIVGLSLGGSIAFQLAVETPQTIKTLTIVNSAPELLVRTFKEKVMLWQRLVTIRLLGMRKMAEILSKKLFIQPEHTLLRQTFVTRWVENDQRAYLDALRAMIGWSVTKQLGTILCPTLVITADHDYTPVSLKEVYTAKIPNAHLVTIPDSRHALPVEKPIQFNRVLQRFLETHS